MASRPLHPEPQPNFEPIDSRALRGSWMEPLPTAAPRWPTLLLCLLAVAVYLPHLLTAGFLNFDDNLFFGPDNPEFREGGWQAILDPRQTIANVYLPVSHLSLYLDYRLFGGDPTGPHLVSLLLHALGGFVMVRWLLAMGLRALPAHVAGLLFLLHPALCESVAWVSSRKDVLSGLFVFLALWASVRLAFRASFAMLLLVAACGVLAMYSKATAVVLPLLAAACCAYVGGARRRWLAPLVLLAVTVPIAWHHQLLAAAEGTLVQEVTSQRMTQAPGALLHYLQTIAAPLQLNVLHPETTFAAFRQALLPGLGVLAVLLFLGHALWRSRWRQAGLGVLLLLLALLPFNTVYPASNVPAADRYLYLALPGAALTVVGLGRLGVVVGMLLLVPLGWLCHERSQVFAGSEAVWRASLAVAPQNAVARINLAEHLLGRAAAGEAQAGSEARELLAQASAEATFPQHRLRAERALLAIALPEGRYEAAVAHAEQALAAARELPASPAARQLQLHALLDVYQCRRLAERREAAAAALAEAEQLVPDAPVLVGLRAQVWLEQVLAEVGPAAAGLADHPRAVQAMAALQAALTRAPEDPLLNRVMGAWEYARGNRLQALAHFRRAIAAAPLDVEAYVNAAELLHQSQLFTEAEKYARMGLVQRPAEPRLRQWLALALAGQGRTDDAIQHMEAYVQARPRDRGAARVLSNLLMGKALSMGTRSHAELEALLARALKWNPDEPKADILRARMCREQRQWREAIGHLERARLAFPGQEDLQRMLAETWRDLGYELWLGREREAADDAFLRFLELAPADLPTDAVRQILQNEWRRLEKEGVTALQQGDAATAERCFRRCLQLDPAAHWAAWLLATVLQPRQGADRQEVDRLLVQAIDGQRRHGLDASRQVALRVLNLQQLGRQDEAVQLAREFLAAPGDEADPQALQLLRKTAGG